MEIHVISRNSVQQESDTWFTFIIYMDSIQKALNKTKHLDTIQLYTKRRIETEAIEENKEFGKQIKWLKNL